ncbi:MULTISPECIES: hypothetical protein [Methylobacterium]|uniref:Uncharacterized protein n=1 Tax=Methylobacterium longum TaxID=767694 RepID=A0ABT8AS99_9HYPH|nr:MULTISPECIES: hypothetical protein [Methylobacterium]MCJ2099173.1 hypothetical protein [Methylobacterium sp. E-046]MDN3572721.1 hypothetical protein [Methylobacterium longum]GJE10155.1 hypothetical protein FOHLNKBM_1187 [Methylobacterium longum]
MTVLLRAALVIGVLSYFALMRTGADPAAEARRLAGALPTAQTALDAVPTETRERAMRAVLARGLMAELSRRAAEPPSTDTLEDADRQPAWRGIEPR